MRERADLWVHAALWLSCILQHVVQQHHAFLCKGPPSLITLLLDNVLGFVVSVHCSYQEASNHAQAPN